jgi:hypothetical protein
MPKDRPTSNFDHRLGTKNRLFAESGAQPAGKDNCFHFNLLLPEN